MNTAELLKTIIKFGHLLCWGIFFVEPATYDICRHFVNPEFLDSIVFGVVIFALCLTYVFADWLLNKSTFPYYIKQAILSIYFFVVPIGFTHYLGFCTHSQETLFIYTLIKDDVYLFCLLGFCGQLVELGILWLVKHYKFLLFDVFPNVSSYLS